MKATREEKEQERDGEIEGLHVLNPADFLRDPSGEIDIDESSDDPFAAPDDDIEEMAESIEEENIRKSLSDTKTLQKIDRAFIGQAGMYGRLYNVSVTGKHTRYTTIRDFSNVSGDFEEYIRNLVEENEDWPGGHWLLQICDAKHKIKRSVTLHLPEKPKKSRQEGSEVATSAIKQNAEMMDKLLTLAKENKDSTTPLLLEILKENKSNSMEDMVKMLAIMRELNPPTPKADNTQVLTALITAAAPIVVKLIENSGKRKEPDIVSQLQALKEISGNNPENSFNSALGMLNRVMETVQGMQPPAGNPWSEAFKQIMPHVGEVFSNVTGALNNVVQAKREALALQAGQLHGRRQLPGPEANGSVSAEAMPISSQTQEDTANMHPVIKRVYDAVIEKDTAFYPELENIIRQVFTDGKERIEALMDGGMTVPDFVGQVTTLIPQFNRPDLKEQMVDYMNGFVFYKLEEFEANSFMTECPKCGNRVSFGSEAEYKEDSEGGICGEEGCTEILQPVQAKQETAEVAPVASSEDKSVVAPETVGQEASGA